MMNWAAQSCRAAAACCSKYILSSRSNQQLQFCRCGLPASLASFCVTKHKKSILCDPSIISIKEFVLRYNIITYIESEVIFRYTQIIVAKCFHFNFSPSLPPDLEQAVRWCLDPGPVCTIFIAINCLLD